MVINGRAAATAPAVLLAAVALVGCSSRDAHTATTSAPPAASATTSTPGPSAATPPGVKVAPSDLAAIASDRTFRGDDGGEPYAEYYAPDGSLRGKSGAVTYSGSWKVVGDQLCFTYPIDAGNSEVGCYTVFKDGDTITWVDSEGRITPATYSEGNPDNL